MADHCTCESKASQYNNVCLLHAVQLLQNKFILQIIQISYQSAPVLTQSQAQSPTEEVTENSLTIS